VRSSSEGRTLDGRKGENSSRKMVVLRSNQPAGRKKSFERDGEISKSEHSARII
jgi:hypothetical protein